MTEPPLPPWLDTPDLLRGGPLFRLLRRFGVDLVEARHVARRSVLIGVCAWLPMAVLCLIDGTFLPGGVHLPFAYDVAAFVRPLVATPLLLAAEPIVGAAWRVVIERFASRGIVEPSQLPELKEAVARALARRDRWTPEVLCALTAAILTVAVTHALVIGGSSTWLGTDGPSGFTISAAGLWYATVVVGGGMFLLLRWIWRIALWHALLFRIARMPLRLHPTHPDHACGLEFVMAPLQSYAMLAFAVAVSFAARFANRLLHDGAHLTEFLAPAGIIVGIVLLLAVLPPALVFSPLLARTKRDALLTIGAAAAACGDRFLTPPTAAPAAPSDPTAGSASRHPLPELLAAAAEIRAIRPVPLDVGALGVLVASIALPGLGLALLEIPAGEILARAAKLLF